MSRLIKQYIVFILSIFVVMTSIQSAYASASSWTANSLKYISGQVIVSAIKNNAKSLVKVAPSVSSLGKFLLKGSGSAAIAYAISKALDATDYVLDPANNAIRYKVSDEGWEYRIDGKGFDSVEQACKHVWSDQYLSSRGYKKLRLPTGSNQGKYYYSIRWYSNFSFYCSINVGHLNQNYEGNIGGFVIDFNGSKYGKGEVEERSISADVAASMVIDNAKSGHTQSQQAVVDVVSADVQAGAYDNVLQANSVPINGADGKDGKDGVDGSNGADAPPFDPSSIINALSSLADRITSSFSRLEVKADSIVQEQQDIKRVINTSTNSIIDVQRETQAKVVTAVDTVGHKIDKQGKLINGNIDNLIDKVKITNDLINTQTDAIKTAIEGLEIGLDSTVINDAVDKVIDGQKTQTDAIKDAIKDNTDKIVDNNKTNTKEITDRLDKIDDFLLDKPQDLPRETVPLKDINLKNPAEFDRLYVNAPKQCPPDVRKDVPIGSNTFVLVLPMSPVCDFGSNYVKPVINFMALILTALSISNMFKV